MLYKDVYKKYGGTKITHLMSPITKDESVFRLPVDSIYHHLTAFEEVEFPTKDSFPFNGKLNKILIHHVDKLEVTTGVRKNTPFVKGRTDFNTASKGFSRLSKPAHEIRNKASLIMYNYEFLKKGYVYKKLNWSDYIHYKDILDTMFKNINNIANVSDREHFITIRIPDKIPSFRTISLLSNYNEKKIVESSLDRESWLVLEICKWIDITIENSILNNIEYKNIHKVNFIFRSQGQFTLINLGVLLSLVEDSNTMVPETAKGLSGFLDERLISAGVKINQTKDAKVVSKMFITYLSKVHPNIIIDDSDSSEEGSEDPEELPHRGAEEPEEDNLTLEEELEAEEVILQQIEDSSLLTDDSDIMDINFNDDTVIESFMKDSPPEETLLEKINTKVDSGNLLGTEYRKLVKNVESSKKIKSVTDKNKTLNEATVVTTEDRKLNNEDKEMAPKVGVIDKAMLTSSNVSFTKKYIKDIKEKHIGKVALSLQNAGVILMDFNKDVEEHITGDIEVYTLKVKPIDGEASTLKIRLPVMKEDGTFISNDRNYFMRNQLVDLPIRKIKHDEVSLSSYYGKVFVQRSKYRVNDPIAYIVKRINEAVVDDLMQVIPMSTFNSYRKVPAIYSSLSMHFKQINFVDTILSLDYDNRFQIVSKLNLEQIDKIEKTGYVYCGLHERKALFVNIKSGYFFNSNKEGILTEVGDIYTLLIIDSSKAPTGFVEVRCMGQKIPIVTMFGYKLGITDVLKLFKANPTVIPSNKRIALTSSQYAIKFQDVTLVLDKKNRLATSVLGGLNAYKKILKTINYKDLNTPSTYMVLLEHKKQSNRILKEFDNIYDMFVDPITKEVLVELNLPTTTNKLLYKATEMLLDDNFKNPNDVTEMRLRGYERVAGKIYKELAVSVREYKNRTASRRRKLELNPFAVAKSISEDPTKTLVDEINPIHNLKEQESVTLIGQGGRTKETVTLKDRLYHPSAMGTISESTVDSGDVAINTTLSASPGIDSTTGIINEYDGTKSNLLSTSAILSPFSTHDDPKRCAFIANQQSHSIAAKGYAPPVVRTGYEKVISQRVSSTFSSTSKGDGKVTDKTDTAITITYKDGSVVSYPTIDKFGMSEGSLYKHPIVTGLKVGDKIIKGDTITYNEDFFTPDFFNPKEVIFKNSINTTVAFCEARQTYEDSSSISKTFSEKMASTTIQTREFSLGFKQEISNLIGVNKTVEPSDILFMLQDDITNDTGVFTNDNIETLEQLSGMAPKANYVGKIEKIELFYHGETEDMSDSIKSLAMKCDKNLRRERKEAGLKPMPGKVDTNFRYKGTSLPIDTALLRVSISVTHALGVSDKIVTSLQMKSVIGKVYDYSITDTDGNEIDMIFGYKSLAARIVTSPVYIGMLSKILTEASKKLHKL